MAAANKRNSVFAVVAVVAILAAAAAWHYLRPVTPPAPPSTQVSPPAAPAVRQMDETMAALSWRDIDAALASAPIGTEAAEALVSRASGTQHPPAIYLAGMLRLAAGRPAAALDTFDRLKPEAIPPVFLYPPYRLQRQLNPMAPNRYLPYLRDAIAAGRVPALIAARVDAQEGDLRSAFSAYLQTDTAQWTSFDVYCLERIATHQGLANEVRTMVSGALHSGRLSAPVDAKLRQLATRQDGGGGAQEMKGRMLAALTQDPAAAKTAADSAAQLLEVRKRFLQRDYAGLLASHEGSEPVALTTETVLYLFLSAVERDNRPAADRWGQELKRRHPGGDTTQWVNSLTATAE